MSHHQRHPKETSQPQTSKSDSQKARDNERDEDDDGEQPVRTNLMHQFSIRDANDAGHNLGHDQDEQATKVDQRRRRFVVDHLKELFEDTLKAKHVDYGETIASIVKYEQESRDVLHVAVFLKEMLQRALGGQR